MDTEAAMDLLIFSGQNQESHHSVSPTLVRPGVVEAKGKSKIAPNKSKDAFVVTMVHGDLLLFIGDDFEVYSATNLCAAGFYG